MILRFKKVNLRNLLIYIEAFLIIQQSGSVQAAILPDGISYKICRLALLGLTSYFVAISINKKINIREKYLFYVLILFTIPIIINLLIYSPGFGKLLYKVLLFVLFYFLGAYSKNRNNLITEAFYRIIIIIAVVSLVLYVIIDCFNINIPYSMIRSSEGGYYYRNYLNLYYSYHGVTKEFLYRLSGFFWEPGMYGIYLNYALYIYVSQRKNKKWEIFILLVNILVTQSTTGYIVTTILLGTMFVKTNKIKKEQYCLLAAFVLPVVLAVLVVLFLIKRSTTNHDIGSYYLRMNDIINGIKVFLQNPICGTGFYNEEPFKQLDYYGRGSSNGFLTWCYTTGIIGIIIALFPFISRIVASKGSDRNNKFLYFFIIVIFNNAEPIYSLPFMVYILAEEYFESAAVFERKQ
jgi:O-Antigen ligase.